MSDRPKCPYKVRFTVDEANNCGWTFNCGPGALCAILDMTPQEIRPHMLDFERKGYTNPTLMFDILKGLGVQHKLTYRSDAPDGLPLADWALVRVQWDGPWTKPGVPMQARYRQTHWIGLADNSKWVFDVNATCSGGWIPFLEWITGLVPWLLKAVVPRATGGCWFTHVIEVENRKPLPNANALKYMVLLPKET